MKKPSFFPVIIGTGFGSGFSPFAPGTAGALLAVLIWFGISFIVSEICLIWLTVALILFFTVMGVWATNRLEPFWGEDPSRVVVDEMVGVWIALLAAPSGNVWYALGAFAGELPFFFGIPVYQNGRFGAVSGISLGTCFFGEVFIKVGCILA